MNRGERALRIRVSKGRPAKAGASGSELVELVKLSMKKLFAILRRPRQRNELQAKGSTPLCLRQSRRIYRRTRPFLVASRQP